MTRKRKGIVEDIRFYAEHTRRVAEKWGLSDQAHRADGPRSAEGTAAPLQPAPTKSKRRRRPGGGRKRALTAAEVIKLQKFYRRALPTNQKTAADNMRKLLKRFVSDSTLQRWAMQPVLAQIAGQNKTRRSK